TDKVQRANLDGSDLEDLVTAGLVTPRGIALDLAARKMYWIDSGNDTIKRANLDGSEVETLLDSGLSTPEAIALEVPVRGGVQAYDAVNRRTSATDAYGSVSLSEYDRTGNLLTSVDALGGAQYYAYDALG